jgi:hypothetical protein
LTNLKTRSRGRRFAFAEIAESAKSFVTLAEELLDRLFEKLFQILTQGRA